jgi:hypothetical protein
MKAFENQFFPKGYYPDVIGLPIPNDLEVDSNKIRWIASFRQACLTFPAGLFYYKANS